MKKKKGPAKPKKSNTRTKSIRTTREQDFEEAILQLGKEYPELAGRFVVAKASSVTSPLIQAVSADFSPRAARRCKEWGLDPVTGEMICIQWE